MYCNNCGNEIKPGVKFCGKCGLQVTDNTVGQAESNKKSWIKWVIIAFAVMIVIVILVVAILFVKGRKSTRIYDEANTVTDNTAAQSQDNPAGEAIEDKNKADDTEPSSIDAPATEEPAVSEPAADEEPLEEAKEEILSETDKRNAIVLKKYEECLSAPKLQWNNYYDSTFYDSDVYSFDIVRVGKTGYPILLLHNPNAAHYECYVRAYYISDDPGDNKLHCITANDAIEIFPDEAVVVSYHFGGGFGEVPEWYNVFDDSAVSSEFWGYRSVLDEETIQTYWEAGVVEPFENYYIAESAYGEDFVAEHSDEIWAGNTDRDDFEKRLNELIGDKKPIAPEYCANTPGNRKKKLVDNAEEAAKSNDTIYKITEAEITNSTITRTLTDNSDDVMFAPTEFEYSMNVNGKKVTGKYEGYYGEEPSCGVIDIDNDGSDEVVFDDGTGGNGCPRAAKIRVIKIKNDKPEILWEHDYLPENLDNYSTPDGWLPLMFEGRDGKWYLETTNYYLVDRGSEEIETCSYEMSYYNNDMHFDYVGSEKW